jgi:hypothetical protein
MSPLNPINNPNRVSSHYHVIVRLLVAEPEGWTPPVPNPAIGHDPETVPSTSHDHNLVP